MQALCTKCEPALAVVFKNKGDWCVEHELPESICPICHPERGGRPAVEVTGDLAPPDGIEVRLASTIIAPAIGLEVVAAKEARAELELEALARVAYDPGLEARVSAPVPGTLTRLFVAEGQRVARGDVLAHITSGELGDRQARLSGARARVRLARQAVERLGRLTVQGAASTQNLDDARSELVERQVELAALVAQLEALGGGGTRVDDPAGDVFELSSPIDGIVTRFEARVGVFVEPGEALFEVVDPSVVWADLEIPESDAHLVAEGQPVSLRFDGLPETPWSGPLTALSPEVDPHTRSVRARVRLDNPQGRLKKNLWGRAIITAERPPTSARGPVLVPRGSVQVARGVSLVFVRRRGDLYEGRRVQPGRVHGDWIEVTGRLAPGEEVVLDGAYLLKTETLRDAIGAGCCDHGPGVR